MSKSPLRFVIISLGNPRPYHNSFHSAGHHVLSALPPHLDVPQPDFSSRRVGGTSTMASISEKYTLLQSPSVMNVSGRWVSKAWKEMAAASSPNLGLILVCDELEVSLGQFRIKKWDASHRGHNGVKDVNKCLMHKEYPSSPWARLVVGVSRPKERDHDSVSGYVLRDMNQTQREAVREAGVAGVLQCMKEMEEKWMKKQQLKTTGQ